MFFKSLFDRGASFFGLILLFPVLLVVALLIRIFYRAAGSHGMLVMVNTANESVQVKVPMEHAGKTMTDVIAGVDVELPTVMTMEPYQYFIYQQ